VRQRAIPMKGRAVFELGSEDGYQAIVRRLGQPDSDHGSSQGGVEYRALAYSDLRLVVILRGGPADARYLGTMDANWHPIHWVALPSGESSAGLLRGLKRF